MTNRGRLVLFAVGAAGLGVLLLWAVVGLPRYGHYRGPYGDVINAAVTGQRHIAEAVGAVTFDYRGIDTLGEEVILFASVAAVAIVFRAQNDEEDELDEQAGRSADVTSETVRFIGQTMLPLVVLLGLYVVGHGHVSPGGGFQGGVVVAGSLVMLYVTGDYRAMHETLPPTVLDPAEATGVAGYVFLVLLGLVVGSAALDNVLPLGTSGQLNSGGIVPFLNLTVGLEVGAGIVLITLEFLNQMVRVPQRTGTVTAR